MLRQVVHIQTNVLKAVWRTRAGGGGGPAAPQTTPNRNLENTYFVDIMI
jgi:hypothetical protein